MLEKNNYTETHWEYSEGKGGSTTCKNIVLLYTTESQHYQNLILK